VLIKSGLRAAIARRIRSAIRRFELGWTGLDWTPAALWVALAASGVYHGVNPGMGWPLAVSAGLMERSSRGLVAALWPCGARNAARATPISSLPGSGRERASYSVHKFVRYMSARD
jgi:hypothetical protein